MLFAFADCSQWLITTPAAVNGEVYISQPRDIIMSSSSSTPYKARWVYRATNQEDPWVSVHDHNSASMMYGENGVFGHSSAKNAAGGANVYIRDPDPAPTPGKGS